MIIDNHCHLVDKGWIHDSVLIGMAKIATGEMGKTTGEYSDPVALAKDLVPILSDPTGEKLVATMDAAGVDKSCIFTTDWGLLTGEPEVPIEKQNQSVSEAAKRFPSRLIPFFSIDPRRKEATKLFEKAIKEWGMKGLKLHPGSGYFPYDKECYPLYELCMKYHLPVLIHTSSISAPLKARFAEPINVDDVAADFPELPIIMAHSAHNSWEQAMLISFQKRNIYLDFSGWQIRTMLRPHEAYRILRRIIDEIGPWRVFFGSDDPFMGVMCPLDRWVKMIKEPDLSSCPEVSFTEEEKEIIMGKAFARLMGMPY